MSEQNGEGYLPDAEVLRRILDLFEKAAPSSREKLLHTLHTFFLFDGSHRTSGQSLAGQFRDGSADLAGYSPDKRPSFSEDRAVSPKEFIMEKRPQTDVEKVACLAYFLSHYRENENFKTLDISKLNTEAAQIKLSNAAQAVENATRSGLIIPSVKGHKKISALGEIYVQALPDKVAAKQAVAHARPKRKRAKS